MRGWSQLPLKRDAFYKHVKAVLAWAAVAFTLVGREETCNTPCSFRKGCLLSYTTYRKILWYPHLSVGELVQPNGDRNFWSNEISKYLTNYTQIQESRERKCVSVSVTKGTAFFAAGRARYITDAVPKHMVSCTISESHTGWRLLNLCCILIP